MHGWWCAAAVLGVGLSGGCGGRPSAVPSAPVPTNPAPAVAREEPSAVPSAPVPTNPAPAVAREESIHLKHALPRLRTMKLWLGSKELTVELALSPVEIATGMMFRKQLPENEGMLFAFAAPYRAEFYMKNTLVPLSVAYIDPEGTILEIHDLQPLDETPQPASSDQVQFALEVNQGWFKRNQIGVGTGVRTEHGSLLETFLPSRRR